MAARLADSPTAGQPGPIATIASDSGAGLTRHMASWAAGFTNADMSALASEWAKHCLLDWFAVSFAAHSEPLVKMLVDEYAPDANGPCTVFGFAGRARPHDAVLINGAIGHALDYDDVNMLMFGHPTVPVAPVVLALGEVNNISGADLLRAFVAGYEVESRIGTMCAPSHYLHGFHITGTVGTFGAAAAAANLLGLNADASTNALGIAAAQAAGLKSMFGTMTKPLHAGKAAMNGLIAAQLAARGFTANEAGIECAQGFAATQVPEFVPSLAPIDTSKEFCVQHNLFKYHAACYLIHSSIEAIRRIRSEHGLGLDQMESMSICVPESHKRVCDIREPVSGMNIKFSIRHLAVMALDGCDSAALEVYSDANAHEPRYVQARRKVELTPSESDAERAAVVTVKTKDGETVSGEFNVAIPATDTAAQWARLTAKARAIVTPVLGEAGCEALISAVAGLDKAPDLKTLLTAARALPVRR